MYLKNIAIKNIGPIDELFVELPFKENGDPKPIIFVGENGKGKTILQSQVVDAFYEIGSGLFEDVGKQKGVNRSYYKISGGLNLQTGKDSGFSALIFTDNKDNKIEYFDKVGDVKKGELTALLSDFTLSPDDTNSNQKMTTSISDASKKDLQSEWMSSAHFYQPAYRYEEPFWKNSSFLDDQRFADKKRYSNNLNKDIEIITATKDNKTFLMDLVLDFTVYPENTTDKLIWGNINSILRKIMQRDDIRFGIGPRGAYRVSIVEQNPVGAIIKQLLPSIDSLSLGESILLNLFINIIRHADSPPKGANDITGIIAIDEIDVHLHTNLQSRVLPELIKLFPKVQFVVTTHSPLFLLGMKSVFGDDGFEIRNMPSGEVITTERFSEFGKAYEVLKNTEKFEEELKEKVGGSTKPIFFVEGDYDIQYIKKAAKLLGKEELLNRVNLYDGEGYGNLDKIWKNYDSKLSEVVPQKILLLYDCDTNKTETRKGKVFKKIVPSIDANLVKKGIENLFPKSTIAKAQAHKNAFIDHTPEIKKTVRGVEQVEEEEHQVNKDEKSNLCTWLCENGTEEDFSNFESIFLIFEEILSEGEQPS